MQELDLPHRVYLVVAAIPKGKVASYGQIASMAGSPRSARQVGYILKKLPKNSQLPWFRVVNHQGKISLTGIRQQIQQDQLLAEGILFKANHGIDLRKYGWQIES